ncbi:MULTISPECIES: OmpA family protein [unclassified Wenzhouxiangella]|uniref:OmpA family protein n=1 Tax=unclassified Wenzhouxiangella TaxID=2613841 RepID=UPI0015F28A8C|nr:MULTISPECIES: OmpA family protein [unclassified Wenzhouxiangella]
MHQPTRILTAFLLLTLSAEAASQPAADAGRHYPDGHGGEVFFPMGDRSFADEVVSFNAGDPDGGDASARPEAVLNVPDYADVGDPGFLTLGCTGDLVVAMTDNNLIDIAGPDLYVFEVGPDTEATALAISKDGEDWIRVGRIAGGKAEVDIAPYVEPGGSYRYVRLVDLKQACNSRTPGADVDAIGAIGSATKIALDSEVLFDSGEHRLKPGAHEALEEIIASITNPAGTHIEVAGHTDSVGSEDSNLALSENRARSVAGFLIESGHFGDDAITTQAFGESRPIASNDTAEGRARNRRVELTVRSKPEADNEERATVDILGVWDAGEHGVMELRRVDGAIEGDYTLDNGAVLGEFVSDTVFEGHWIEDDSRRACDSEKDGRDHWGHLRIEFETAERDRFEAYWRYCGEEEDRGAWRGRLERLL